MLSGETSSPPDDMGPPHPIPHATGPDGAARVRSRASRADQMVSAAPDRRGRLGRPAQLAGPVDEAHRQLGPADVDRQDRLRDRGRRAGAGTDEIISSKVR